MQNNTLVKYTMTYGLYLGLAFSAVIFILHLAGKIHFPGDQMAMFNSFLLMVGIVIFGRKYRELFTEGNFTYKQAFGFSMLLVLFSAIIYTFFSYFYYQLIQPEAIPHFIRQMEMAYTQSSALPEDQIHSLIELYRTTLNAKAMAFAVFFMQHVGGVAIALVAAFLIRTPNIQQRDL